MMFARETKHPFIIDATIVQTEIKLRIKKDVQSGQTEATVNKHIKEIIRKFSKGIIDAGTREEFEVALGLSAKKWLKEYRALFLAMGEYRGVSKLIAVNKRLIKAAQGLTDDGQAFQGLILNLPNRPYVTDAKQGLAVIEDYDKKVKAAYNELLTRYVNSDAQLPGGMSLRNYAEVKVRYEANMADMESLRAADVSYVWISSHADASDRCAPWQGRLYSLDGTSGTIDGISYVPIEVAMRGEKGDGNGILSGYNCRHRIIVYENGSQAPKDYDHSQIQEAQRVDKRQREYEREIRRTKLHGFLTIGTERSEAFEKARKLEGSYRRFSEAHNTSALLWRTRVMREEMEVYKL